MSKEIMNFKHDILLVDIEATGLDVSRHEIIQLAGVLLDKKTLKEKRAFSTFVRPLSWKRRDPESMKVNRITLEQVKNSPSLKNALLTFNSTFGRKVTLSYYVGVMDIIFLQAAYKKVRLPWPFDYHYFNIWGLFYAYLASKSGLKSKKDFAGFNLEDLGQTFGLEVKSSTLHDALVDCRLEADVLRKIMKSM